MGVKITKIDSDTFTRVYESEPETLSLKAIRDQIKALQDQLKADEPSKKELEEIGKMYHEYYTMREEINNEILRLQNLEDELKKL